MKQKKYKCKVCNRCYAYKKCVINHMNKLKHQGLVLIDTGEFRYEVQKQTVQGTSNLQ